MACSSRNVACNASESSDDSDDALRKKRHVPHGVFAHALANTRRNNAATNSRIIFGNPEYGDDLKLFCKTHWLLAMSPQGKVYGVDDHDDKYARFRLSSAGQGGHVRIKSVETNMYIGVNKKGAVYGMTGENLEETVWLEELIGTYNCYMSRAFAHLGYYLAIKKSGKIKKAHRTEWGQKAIQFLPIRITE